MKLDLPNEQNNCYTISDLITKKILENSNSDNIKFLTQHINNFV